jgi:hypothetical protein
MSRTQEAVGEIRADLDKKLGRMKLSDDWEPVKPEPKDYHKNEHLQAYRIRRGFDRLASALRLIIIIPVLALIIWAIARDGYGNPPSDAIGMLARDWVWKAMGTYVVISIVFPGVAWAFAGFARDEDLYQSRKKDYGKAMDAWADRSAI